MTAQNKDGTHGSPDNRGITDRPDDKLPELKWDERHWTTAFLIAATIIFSIVMYFITNYKAGIATTIVFSCITLFFCKRFIWTPYMKQCMDYQKRRGEK